MIDDFMQLVREAHEAGHITYDEAIQTLVDNTDWAVYDASWRREAERISPYPLGARYGAAQYTDLHDSLPDAHRGPG